MLICVCCIHVCQYLVNSGPVNTEIRRRRIARNKRNSLPCILRAFCAKSFFYSLVSVFQSLMFICVSKKTI